MDAFAVWFRRTWCAACSLPDADRLHFGRCLQDIDWDALIEKRLDAPWKPNVKDAKDLGNFTDEYPDSDTEDVPYTGDPSWYADF